MHSKPDHSLTACGFDRIADHTSVYRPERYTDSKLTKMKYTAQSQSWIIAT